MDKPGWPIEENSRGYRQTFIIQFLLMQAKTMQWEDDDNYSSWIPPSSQFFYRVA